MEGGEKARQSASTDRHSSRKRDDLLRRKRGGQSRPSPRRPQGPHLVSPLSHPVHSCEQASNPFRRSGRAHSSCQA
eukprot:scaffold291598_cov33-Tisochrysis_lutea.AAC.3